MKTIKISVNYEFDKMPVKRVEGFFKKYFPESEGFLVESVVFDNEENCFVVECSGVDEETKGRYSFTLFAHDPSDEEIVNEEIYPISWSCPSTDNDFWTGDDVQEEYPKFIYSLVK